MWEPLLAIADRCGGEWPVRARRAARVLSAGEARDDEAIGVRLLADCQRIFGDTDRLSSADLVAALCADAEAPWPEWNRGKGITQRGLAKLLTPFGVKSKQVRIDDMTTLKGYTRESFLEAWARYLPPPVEPPPAPGADSQAKRAKQTYVDGLRFAVSEAKRDTSVSFAKERNGPMFTDSVSHVSLANPRKGEDADRPETWPEDYRRWYEDAKSLALSMGMTPAEAAARARREIAEELRKEREHIAVKPVATNVQKAPTEANGAISDAELAAQVAALPEDIRGWFAGTLAYAINTGTDPVAVWQTAVVDVLDRFSDTGASETTP